MEAIEHPSPLVALINLLFAPLGVHIPDHMVFVGLITAEWIIRKANGLV